MLNLQLKPLENIFIYLSKTSNFRNYNPLQIVIIRKNLFCVDNFKIKLFLN